MATGLIFYEIIEHEETPTSEDSALARGESIKIGAKALLMKGKKGLIGLFMGEVMRLSKGKADPKLANQLLRTKLEK